MSTRRTEFSRPEADAAGSASSSRDPWHPDMLYRLLKLGNLIGRPFFSHFSERYDLTMNDLRVLMTLAPMGEAASHELCQVTGMHPMNVSRSVARMRRQGRIAERSDPTNRRRKILKTTAAGQDLYERLTPHVKVISEFLFDTLTAEEAESLSRLVDKLSSRLEAVDLNSSVLIDAEALAKDDQAPSVLRPPGKPNGHARRPKRLAPRDDGS
jgi:DNA-binding MarR family transcriptional regulator